MPRRQVSPRPFKRAFHRRSGGGPYRFGEPAFSFCSTPARIEFTDDDVDMFGRVFIHHFIRTDHTCRPHRGRSPDQPSRRLAELNRSG